MATELNYPEIIKKILLEYLKYDSLDDVIKSSVSFDDEHGNYVLLQAGWRGNEYLQGSVIHIQLIDNKIWIQYDGTEYGVANELVDAGIPKTEIMLGFRHPSVRQYTGLRNHDLITKSKSLYINHLILDMAIIKNFVLKYLVWNLPSL